MLTSRSKQLVILLCLLIAVRVFAEPAVLPIGSTTSLNCQDGQAVVCQLQIDVPGILTVIAQTSNDVDLSLNIADEDGITFWDQPWNDDMGGNPGMELLCTHVQQSGCYQVLVTVTGGEATVTIGGSWLVFDQSQPTQPVKAADQRIGQAIELVAGQTRNGRFDINKDELDDWYQFTATNNEKITVTTQAANGDIVLEAYNRLSLKDKSIAFSDQDIQRKAAVEAITIDVEENQTYYFVVRCQDFSSFDYTITCHQLPE